MSRAPSTRGRGEPDRVQGRVHRRTSRPSTPGVEQRDGHLRSADFFDAENHPTATFASTRVEAKGGSDYAVTGDLTIRGTTRPVTFEVEHLGFYTGMNGARRAGFHATGRINREEFGLNWNVALETGGWLVGKDIKLEFDLAVEQAEAAKAEGETQVASHCPPGASRRAVVPRPGTPPDVLPAPRRRPGRARSRTRARRRRRGAGPVSARYDHRTTPPRGTHAHARVRCRGAPRPFPALPSSRTAGPSPSSTAPAAPRSRTRSSRRSRLLPHLEREPRGHVPDLAAERRRR